MSSDVREQLEQVLETLSEDDLQGVLQFARFVRWERDYQQWQQFGRAQLARAYGPNEPEYTESDLKAKQNS